MAVLSCFQTCTKQEYHYYQLELYLQSYHDNHAGGVDTENLVIAGHNYKRHFGKLTNLRIGDEVALTTMDGTTYRYQVEQVETLDSTAIDEMTAGDYPLTLFTCDYSGQARIAVRCQQTS